MNDWKKAGLEGRYVQVKDPELRVTLLDGKYTWGDDRIHSKGNYKVRSLDEYECHVEFSTVRGLPPDHIRITREGAQYLFAEMPAAMQITLYTRADGVEFLADSKGRKKPEKPTLGESEPTGKYLPVDATVEEFETGIVQIVRKEVIPWLIKKGKLTGKKEKGALHVLDDAAFRRTMQFGIEHFLNNQQGWTFVAVKAPIASVAPALQTRKGVLLYREHVGASRLEDAASPTAPADTDKRHVFIIQFPRQEWTVLIQTVHWSEAADADLAKSLGKDLSKALKTRAIVACDHDVSGSFALFFNDGQREGKLPVKEDSTEFDARFYEEGIFLPETFIASEGQEARLLLKNPDASERVDYAQIALR